MTTKGEKTRAAILDEGLRLSSAMGLEGLTIGHLAESLRLSKSGLFAHFGSKENLQVEVLERAGQRFAEVVVLPTLKVEGGEERLRVLFERWLEWPRRVRQPGGCIFVAAATELDDRPGPARDRLVALWRSWIDTVERVVGRAQDRGELRRDLDRPQFAVEMVGIGLAFHMGARLLGDSKALERARTAFERLLADARARR